MSTLHFASSILHTPLLLPSAPPSPPPPPLILLHHIPGSRRTIRCARHLHESVASDDTMPAEPSTPSSSSSEEFHLLTSLIHPRTTARSVTSSPFGLGDAPSPSSQPRTPLWLLVRRVRSRHRRVGEGRGKGGSAITIGQVPRYAISLSLLVCLLTAAAGG